ncbi:MAG: hypothetical protein Q4P72_05125 [Eubacteriales bacterium]|nr:hypothetical protein [Eubacteriales bacterium]
MHLTVANNLETYLSWQLYRDALRLLRGPLHDIVADFIKALLQKSQDNTLSDDSLDRLKALHDAGFKFFKDTMQRSALSVARKSLRYPVLLKSEFAQFESSMRIVYRNMLKEIFKESQSFSRDAEFVNAKKN